MSERLRRLVHLSGTVVPAAYLAGIVSWSQVQWFLLAVAAAAAVVEAVRLGAGLDWWLLAPLARGYEADQVAGYALYTWSVTAVAWTFAPPIAVAGTLMLTVGDPVAGALGRLLGGDAAPTATAGAAPGNADRIAEGASEPVGQKPPAVLLATFLVCVALALPFTVEVAGPVVGGAAAAVGAAGATVADGYKPVVRGYVVDDNLSIPPVACTGIWATLRVASAAGVAGVAAPVA